MIQDILVGKKSIRAIKKTEILSPAHKQEKSFSEKKERYCEPDKKVEKINNFSENISSKKITKGSQIFLWIVSFSLIAILLFLVSSFFSTASVIITPKSQLIALKDTFEANSSSSPESKDLRFEIMTLKQETSKSIETDGEEDVERKSTGKAVIYNNYSQTKQRLINNTRLESIDGLIYRIRQSIDVPGYKTVSGKRVPGSVEVEIIADTAGDKYNMKISDLKGDFTIPGFKGNPKYSAFYGRLSSDITGGFVGKVKKVSEEKLSAGVSELKNTLKENLLKELYQKIPEQYVVFKDNYYIEYNQITDEQPESDKYNIKEEATINALMFKKTNLAEFLAKQKIKNYDGFPVDILWGDDLSVLATSTEANPWTQKTLKFKFTGVANLVWIYDSTGLTNLLLGQDKSIINSFVNNEFKDSIKNISAIIRPQWKSTFPDKISKIKLFDSVRNTNITN